MKIVTVKSVQEFDEAFSKALVDGAHLVSVKVAYPKRNNERFTMKRVFLFVVLTIIVVIVGYTSVQAYNNFRVERTAQQAAATVEAKAAAAKAWASQQLLNMQINSLKNQCAKDHQLFVDSKGKSPNGDCDPSLTIVQ